ncbi:MAG: hypothetical protein HOV80_19380 [Polyangiaceae bacterium]|nr:hypothetical protein [Polyangiaceae bacterium]
MQNAPLLRISLLATALTGCDGCRDDHPSVPFSVSASAPASASAAPTPSAETSAFAPVEAQPAASGGAVFELSGRPVRARAGRVFKSALSFDADGDQIEDLVALTEASDGRKAEVAFFRGSEQAASESVLVGLPSDLDVHRCSKKSRLAQIAPTLVSLEIEATCDKGQKEQWIAVFRLDAARSKAAPRAPELRLDVRAKAPLAIRITSDDRDHDGHADLLVYGKLGEGANAVEAPIALLDRPAGYALDPSEPEATLGKLGEKLAAQAKTADVREQAIQLASLARAICDDLGEATLKSSSGGAKCGETKFLADAFYATGLSYARTGDLGRAAAALEGLALLELKADRGRRAGLEAALDAKAKPVEAVVLRRVAARPSSKPGILAPFAWTDADHLLVAGDTSVTKVDVNVGNESVEADAIAWPRTVGWRAPDSSIEVLGAAKVCDPPERRVLATARSAKTQVKVPSVLDLLPRGTGKASCKPGSLALTALAVDGAGATVTVGTEVYRLTFGEGGLTATAVALPLDVVALSPPGSARSADGKAYVLALTEGLLVTNGDTAARWKGPDTKGLGMCAISPDGARVACLSNNTVVILGKK